MPTIQCPACFKVLGNGTGEYAVALSEAHAHFCTASPQDKERVFTQFAFNAITKDLNL